MPSKCTKTTSLPLTANKTVSVYPASPTLVKNMAKLDVITPEQEQAFKAIVDKVMESSYKHLEESDTILKMLRPYQYEDVKFLHQLRVRFIFNQQRTGKTPTSLVVSRMRGEKDGIIIAPASTLYSWKQEVDKWHALGECVVVPSTWAKKKREKFYQEFQGTIVLSYGLASNDTELLVKHRPNNGFMIIDEAHRLRNFRGPYQRTGGKTAKNILKVRNTCDNVSFLTGTPTPNKPDNVFGILCIAFPKLFNSYWNYVSYYYDTEDVRINRQGDTRKEIKDIKPDKLEEHLEFIALRATQRKRSSVMKWIPPVDYKVIEIPMSKQENKMMKELVETYELEEQDIVCVNDLDLRTKLRLLSCSPLLLSAKIAGTKTEWLLQYVKDYPNKPIVITSMMTSYLKELHKLIPDSRLIIGDTPTRSRKFLQEDFNSGKFNVLLGNIDVIKEGMSFWRSEAIIFTDRSYVPSDNEQTEDRLIPITEEIAAKKEGQEIIRLDHISDTGIPTVDSHREALLEVKAPKTAIINDYIKTLKDWREKNGKTKR